MNDTTKELLKRLDPDNENGWATSHNSNFLLVPISVLPEIRKKLSLASSAEAAERRLNDLLAIIHRDGGHYRAENGDEKAYQDAIKAVSSLIGRVDTAERELVGTRERAKALEKDLDGYREMLLKKTTQYGKAEATISTQAAEIERLRGALEWYTNPEIYKPHPHGPAFDDRDLSFKAKAALTQPQPEGQKPLHLGGYVPPQSSGQLEEEQFCPRCHSKAPFHTRECGSWVDGQTASYTQPEGQGHE